MVDRRSTRSKGVLAFCNTGLLAGVALMLYRYLPLLAATTLIAQTPSQAPVPIPSRIVNAIEFTDNGNTYRVDLETKTVHRVSSDVVVPPAPQPPVPNPPSPTPQPELTGLALRVNSWFRDKIKEDTPGTAQQLAQAIDVTLAKAGGLGLKGQAILNDLRATCDGMGLTPKLKGFPLGDALKIAVGDDPDKIIPALKEAKLGLEAVR